MPSRSTQALMAATVLTACLATAPLATTPAWAAAGAAPAAASSGHAGLRAALGSELPLADATTTFDAASGTFRLDWTQGAAVRRVSVYASTRPQSPRATGQLITVVAAQGGTGSAVLSGLDPSRRWYFELVPDLGPTGTETAVRDIPVPGALNVRDLGGYTTTAGLQVRWGTVFRSASLGGVTPAGDGVLTGLGLREVVDFRSPAEITANGADVLPPGVADVKLPIDSGGTGSIGSLTPAQFAALFGNGKALGYMQALYQQFVDSAADRQQFATTLKAIAAGDSSPLLFHCSAGKDRTGWMSAVLLTALGVPRDEVYTDFLLSNSELAASNAATEAALTRAGYDATLIVPMLTVQSSYLDTAFAEVQQQYGSMDAYLTQGLGLDRGTLAELQVRLLRPQAAS